ncbi:MAG: flagellar biosynthetic protein FliR [Deltaproteobacteria bacterium]|nr:flagellar biosynthetic protein FliR [Deltaproteobacteria bacterium]
MLEGYFYFLVHIFFRSLGAICLLPIGEGVSGFSRHITLAAGMAIFLSPLDAYSLQPGFASISRELAIGLLLGLPAVLAIEAMRTLGELFDTGRGQSMAAMYDPASSLSSSQTGFLFQKCALVFLLVAGILEHIIAALYQSMGDVPAGTAHTLSVAGSASSVMAIVVSTAAASFSVYLLFAALFLICDICVLFLSKAVPGCSFLCEAFQLRSLAGFSGVVLLLHSGLQPILLEAALPRAGLLSG